MARFINLDNLMPKYGKVGFLTSKMKTVKLRKSEIDTILDCIDDNNLCMVHCYCGYKSSMCNKMKDGVHRCELKRTIQQIKEKLKG